MLRLRAQVYASIRQFFSQKQVLEVDTAMLSSYGNTDVSVESFSFNAGTQKKFLHTSPEFAMKRLLAAGSGDIYQLGHVFRRDSSSKLHNCEFTLLEWYRLSFSMNDLIEEISELIICLLPDGEKISKQRYTYQEAMLKFANIDPISVHDNELEKAIIEQGYLGNSLSRDQMLDFVMSICVLPELPRDCLVFVDDYPASQAALAAINPRNVACAERFELILNGVELANGYHELTDAVELESRFQQDNRLRKKRGQAEVPYDVRLLAAMEQGLPDCSGVALGVDRLLMAISHINNIEQIIAFPASRA